MTARGRKPRLVYGNERPCVFGAGLTRSLQPRVGWLLVSAVVMTLVIRVWPPPSPVRAVLIMRFDCESGRKGAEQAGRKLMDSGEASTMEEALSLNGRRGYSAALQKLISSGEATTMDEAGIAFSANARKAYIYVEKYDEEERREHSKKGHAVRRFWLSCAHVAGGGALGSGSAGPIRL